MRGPAATELVEPAAAAGGVNAETTAQHDYRRRERIAENLYRRVTKAGVAVYEVAFRDVDGTQRRQTLEARSERAAAREVRSILAERDRIVRARRPFDALGRQRPARSRRSR